MDRDDVVKKIKDALVKGEIAPWKTEDEAKKEGIPTPENIVVGAMARRAFVEEKSGHKFYHIALPENPYHIGYRCPVAECVQRHWRCWKKMSATSHW
jgi:hypothetical protein